MPGGGGGGGRSLGLPRDAWCERLGGRRLSLGAWRGDRNVVPRGLGGEASSSPEDLDAEDPLGSKSAGELSPPSLEGAGAARSSGSSSCLDPLGSEPSPLGV